MSVQCPRIGSNISAPELQSQEKIIPLWEPATILVELGEKDIQDMWVRKVSGRRAAVAKIFVPDLTFQT